jgi:hypothetical protein
MKKIYINDDGQEIVEEDLYAYLLFKEGELLESGLSKEEGKEFL